MQCPQCELQNPPQSNFCLHCGARLALACAACGAELPEGARFCNKCGAAVQAQPGVPARFQSPEAYTPRHLAEKILSSRSALEGERKQVTVLFADLKGSMELLADRDPEEARKLLDPVLERMMEAVHRYEGTVNQVMGDGIMALFGAPVAHEDHAVRACYAALRMQEAVDRYGDEVQRRHGVPVQIRIGLNSGEVVVRAIGSDLRMDYTAVGQTTHLAARMEQMAKPGSVLATASTLGLAEGYVQVKPLGPVPVRGLEAAIEVYEIVGAGPVRSRLQAAAARGLTPFVGREGELDQLRQALERAKAGHGQVAAVVGEPGVGKSRLFWELGHSHRTQDWLILESTSVSYGRATAYLPVIELLRGYFQIEPRDDVRKVREKVTGKLLALDRALEPALPALFGLLDVPVDDAQWQGLEPSERRRRTLDAVKRLLLRESRVQPLLLIFEDLHWIDAETQAFLDSLVESLPTARALLLVNYRPEYQHGWGSKTYYRQLRIDPLPPESAGELLQALLGSEAGLQPLKQLLIERTEGNPFFLEESVRTLVETKVLVGDRGAYRFAKALPSIQVPATVQAVLAARIDRLPPEDKQLLQSAAVIGKDVPLPLLQAIAELPEDALSRGLTHLQAAEFLYEASLFPEPEYTFKHALTHQVAYQSLLQDRQRVLHARILGAMERLYADRVTEQVEWLAHHALQGGVRDKAVRYLREAGAKAVARSANREAVGFFEQALAVLEQLPESRETLTEALEVRMSLGPALLAIKGAAAPEVELSYARARELCDRLEDATWLFPALWGLWYVNYSRGQVRTARELGERLLAVAESRQDSTLLIEAHHTLWATLVGMGDAVAAQAHLERGLALYDRQEHRSLAFVYGAHDPGACCRWFSGMVLWKLGYPDQGIQRAQEALSLARELGHPLTTAMALYFTAWFHYFRGEHQTAADGAEAARALAATYGFSVWEAAASALSARLQVEQGRGEEGLAQLARGLTATTGFRRVFTICLLAEAYLRERQPEKGLEALTEALAMAEEDAMGFFLPEVHRLKGELVVSRAAGGAGEAEGAFRQAIAIARARQEKSLELRAVTSLGRLLDAQGKREEARRMLAETYGSFSEGFDTRDLRAAKALLDSL
ncbi:MAG: AAA family ATPase [Candidatus Rokubacteria bacterium]|nr:AAA family ATPase [Candidatus Rokubacteria bacterium]